VPVAFDSAWFYCPVALRPKDKPEPHTDIGDASALLAKAQANGTLIAVDYNTPYITRATMEPCNATAHFRGDYIDT
jgi:isoquinoline 1-oxidoreductase beta subunit